jgi:hypothetical protein
MKTVQLKNCKYIKFEIIRDAIIEHIPYSVFNVMYSSKKEIAVFSFWDESYVPASLKEHILGIKGNNKMVDKTQEEIKTFLFK